MTAEQLEAARSERMRQTGHAADTLESARTWIEETGFCLFLPRKQFSASVAPTFVEAVAGQRNPTPDQKQIALAEELLIRLELDGVAVRLNLQGQPGEQPDYVVAAWVLPYVYALRGDRDWRRSPQLTGSRQVSPLAVQAYKQLEGGETTVTKLAHMVGSGASEVAILRAISELWQQLRIIPVIDGPGQPARWQLLKIRFQKAIAEGASTSQVTAISVLASIYLQAVIAATMEDVEQFLSSLTARSKVREVLRALVAARQVHTLSIGHAPHYYVAGTLPEFTQTVGQYTSAIPAYFLRGFEEEHQPAPVVQHPVRTEPAFPVSAPYPVPVSVPVSAPLPTPAAPSEPATAPAAQEVSEPKEDPAPAPVTESEPAAKAEEPAPVAVRKPAVASKSAARATASRPVASSRDRKPSSSGSGSRPSRRPAASGASKPGSSRSAGAEGSRTARSSSSTAAKSATSKSSSGSSWSRAGSGKPASKSSSSARPDARGGSRKPAMAGSSRPSGGARKSMSSSARPKQGASKH